MATIKGKWLLNEVLTPPSSRITENVTFSTDKPMVYEYSEYFKLDAQSGGMIFFYAKTSTGGSTQANIYNRGWVVTDFDRIVNFGETDQEVSEDFYSWFTANATLVEEEPTATVITYNGETIATLEAGQTATIKTAETEVEHDIVVIAGGAKAEGQAETNATVYQFDTFSQTNIITSAGAWSTSNEGYYYAVIPLEIGKAYKVTLQNVTTLARFRVVQADSNVIGSANCSLVIANDTPADGYSLLVFAKNNYLICYGGTANGGEVLVTSVDIEDGDIVGTWTVNESVTPLIDKVRINCSGTFYHRANAVGHYLTERSISYIGYPNTSYKRNYFAISDGMYGIGFSESNLITTDNEFYNSITVKRDDKDGNVTECLTFVIESVEADTESEEYQIIRAWLNANATKQGEETTATVITYNGNEIASLSAGQTATIKCANTEMEHDIVVSA